MEMNIKRNVDVEEKYGIVSHLDRGSFGEIFLVVPLDAIEKGKLYVLKRIDARNKEQCSANNIEQELKLLSSLKHPNIVKYIESFYSFDLYLNIVMQYCACGNLHTKIQEVRKQQQRFQEEKIIEWFVQITLGVNYIHQQNILHRDLKTSNIFLSTREIIKIGDFGISRILRSQDDFATTMIGTPHYMSPEIFSGIPYGQKSDIWSLGCCIYELAELQIPYQARDMSSLVLLVIQGKTPIISENYSSDLKSIIYKMLSKNPDDRPTAEAILFNESIQNHMKRILKTIQNGRRKSTCSTSITNSTENIQDDRSSSARVRRRQKNEAVRNAHGGFMTQTIDKVILRNASRSDSLYTTLEDCFEKYEYEDNNQDDIDASSINRLANLSDASSIVTSMDYRKGSFISATRDSSAVAVSRVKSEEIRSEMRSRYSYTGSVPKMTLMPITGYNDVPLVGVREALKPVLDILGPLDSIITVALTNALSQHDQLSIEESAAIQLYTMETTPVERCLYYVLNKTLRSASRRDLFAWFPYLKLLMTALWKLPSLKATVWRVIQNADLFQEYEEGKCYTWWNLSSCTTTLTVMHTSKFLDPNTSQTLFAIECENGKDIKRHSYVERENEILLPPARYIQVLGKARPAPNLCIIHVREIEAPYELISPPFR